MTIDELIRELETLQEEYGGDLDVTVWQYDGGMDALCDVTPVFDPEFSAVVLETTIHQPSIRR